MLFRLLRIGARRRVDYCEEIDKDEISHLICEKHDSMLAAA